MSKKKEKKVKDILKKMHTSKKDAKNKKKDKDVKKSSKKATKPSKSSKELLKFSISLLKTNIENKSLMKKDKEPKKFIFYKEGKFCNFEITKNTRIVMEIPQAYSVYVNNELVDKTKAINATGKNTDSEKTVETTIRYAFDFNQIIHDYRVNMGILNENYIFSFKNANNNNVKLEDIMRKSSTTFILDGNKKIAVFI